LEREHSRDHRWRTARRPFDARSRNRQPNVTIRERTPRSIDRDGDGVPDGRDRAPSDPHRR
jgi:hypothetical protein